MPPELLINLNPQNLSHHMMKQWQMTGQDIEKGFYWILSDKFTIKK
jgi:hypothetical protein